MCGPVITSAAFAYAVISLGMQCALFIVAPYWINCVCPFIFPCTIKSGILFWHRLTRVVLEKRAVKRLWLSIQNSCYEYAYKFTTSNCLFTDCKHVAYARLLLLIFNSCIPRISFWGYKVNYRYIYVVFFYISSITLYGYAVLIISISQRGCIKWCRQWDELCCAINNWQSCLKTELVSPHLWAFARSSVVMLRCSGCSADITRAQQ